MLGSGVHAVMGTGGAPEGVITAAAVRCLNGYMVGRPGRLHAGAGRTHEGHGHQRPQAHLHRR